MDKIDGDSATTTEVILNGVPASPGIIIGPCFLYREHFWQPEPSVISSNQVKAHIRLFRDAVNKTHKKLKKSYQTTSEQFGNEVAEVLEMQIALLEDKIFLREVEEAILKNLYDASYATFVIFRKKKEYFQSMTNEYFRDRALDIQQLKEMIIKTILGKNSTVAIDRPSILIANSLSPNDTVHFYQQKILGLATNTGGKTSHTAIVARSLGVPAVVGFKKATEMVKTGDTVILDGIRGKMIIHPAEETIAAYEEQQKIFLNLEDQLLQESSQETATSDGKRIYLHANIEFEDELESVNRVSADGIGLFRTEGLYLNRNVFPSEGDQARIYESIAEGMYPREVIIRTLDLGGDKMLPGVTNMREDNPSLGWRAIRFWLDHKTGFLAQLKAILRANSRGNIKVLLPMVSGLGEIFQVRQLMQEAVALLEREGKPYCAKIDLGIMIEIPSVVVMADILAREVDFFSIGTNDLVQYTLAVDRGNEKVANLYSHFHPAVLRMIKMTIDAGQAAGIPVGMCGEMAGDPLAIPLLIAMGFDNLSVAHPVIPEVKKIIRELTVDDCRQLYEDVRNVTITQNVIDIVRAFSKAHFPLLHLNR